MSLRDTLNEKPALAAAVVIVLLVIAGGAVYYAMTSGGGPRGGVPEKAYFVDVETGEVFTDSFTAELPVTPPGKSEPTGARLRMFACGSCEDESKQFKGYVEAMTADAKQARKEMEMLESGELQGGGIGRGGGMPALQEIVYKGETVAAPEHPYTWVGKNSAAGREIVTAPLARCGAEPAVECFPR